jgi:RHS repeat-associated protein
MLATLEHDPAPRPNVFGVAETTRLGLGPQSTASFQNRSWPMSEALLGIEPPLRRAHSRPRTSGKERDSESGLDNFGARYDSSQYGRFMTPDEPLVGQYVSEPQSWNLYSYVQNNPINAVDPDGQDCVYVNDNSVDVQRGDCTSDTDRGIFVNGTINTNSFTYNSQSQSLGFNYTNDDTGALGSATIAGVAPSSGVSSSDLFGAVAQGTQMAAPGVNLAANGLQAFAWVAAPELMALAQCGAAGGGCSAGGTALALIPGLGDLKALGIAAHEEKAIGGVLKQIADGTTKGQEFLNNTGNLPAKAAGYYREFTVPLAGQSGRGAARIVTGAGGEVFYTADHYLTFTRLK